MKSNPSYKYMLFGIALVFLIGMIVVGSRQPTRVSDSMVYPPSAIVENVSQDDWSARHWQWTLSLPAGTNPGQDVTGTSCGYGQTGPVFFLPRNFAPCIVPAGTLILVPITGTECSTNEPAPFNGTSEDELRNCAAREVERYTNIEVRIDGEIVPNIQSYRTSSPLFSVMLPEHNVLGAPAGVTHAVAEGYQVIIKPLAPGEHEIIVHLELADGTVLPDKRTLVTVIEPSWEVPVAVPVIATPGATPIPATPEATPVTS